MGQLDVEGVEVDVADALEELGGPGVGEGLGQAGSSIAPTVQEADPPHGDIPAHDHPPARLVEGLEVEDRMSDRTTAVEILRDGDRVLGWTEEEREQARIAIVGAGVEFDDEYPDKRAQSDAIVDIDDEEDA